MIGSGSVAFTLAVALLVGLAAAPAAALPPDAPLPQDLEFAELDFDPPVPVRFELANGLVVHFLEDPSLPLVDVTMLVRAGAVFEPPEKVGLAALIGTVMRTGGAGLRTPDALDAELEDMASTVETEVGRERATATMSCLARHFPATLSIVADLLRSPTFAQEKLEIARARAIEAVRRQNDDPLEIVGREFSRLHYPGHPYGRSPNIESLKGITREDLVAFHARFFHPDRMILAVSGAVAEKELKRLVEETLSAWPASGSEPPQVPPVTEAVVPPVSLVRKEVSQSAIRIGHLGIDRHDPDRVAISVMNTILGRGGFSARLVKKLRVEEGIAYSVYSTFTERDSRGLFFANTQTRSETTHRAIELLREELGRMRDAGITAEELDVARSTILNRDIFAYATAARTVRRAARTEFDGFPADQHERDLERIRSLTVDDVSAVAAKHLRPEALRVLVVGNPDDFERPLSVLGEVREIPLGGESD